MSRVILSGFLALFVLACGNGSSSNVQRLLDPSSSPVGSPPAGPTPSLIVNPPSLGTAASFSVLGGQTVTNTGPTSVAGDLGVSPGTAVTGFPPGLVLGTTHKADTIAAQAQLDTTNAYNVLSGEPCTSDLTGQDLAGKTLVAGVYCFTSDALLTGVLTLDAQGDANAVFIFKIASKLTVASGSAVLVNGASPCNAFWKVGSSATIGTGASFVGNIVALTSIALQTGANLDGRALARNGEVTLDNDQVRNSCTAGGADGGTDGGGIDAGPSNDGGTDAGSDGGLDAGSDGGTDAGSDGGLDAGNGGGNDGGVVTQCKGICTDLDLDANNCGACGIRCSASQVCRAGACTGCPAKDTQCKEQCADLTNDNANCGACGNVCTGTNGTCIAGVCGACDGKVCGNACVWLDRDHDNCGACGNACAADQCCVNSKCSGSGPVSTSNSCRQH